ncbi:hypothetical protein DW990_05150 [Phocaeicola vulgatus]|nr:hypothetical protein DW990_05150 [Phocaeicola vulgatus]
MEENNFTDVYRDFVDNFYCYYSLLLATKLMNIEPFEVMKSNEYIERKIIYHFLTIRLQNNG